MFFLQVCLQLLIQKIKATRSSFVRAYTGKIYTLEEKLEAELFTCLLCSTTKQSTSVASHQDSHALGHNSWSHGGNTLDRRAQKEFSKPHVSATEGFSWQNYYEGHRRLSTTVILTSLQQCPLGWVLRLWLCLTCSLHYGLFQSLQGIAALRSCKREAPQNLPNLKFYSWMCH